jgi:nitrous oxidase accessory protein
MLRIEFPVSICTGKSITLTLLTSRLLLKAGGSVRTSAFCIATVLLLLSASLAQGATVKVSSNLQAAIDAASPGDTIQVAPGVYGGITVDKSLNLEGQGAVIAAGEREACVRVLADKVKISGFLVRNGFYGISLDEVENCEVSNNTVIYCVQPGIMLKFSNNNVVKNNNASFNGLGGEGWYGIYLTNSNNNLIQENVASDNGEYGINMFPSCNNNTLVGNVAQRNDYGIYMFTGCEGNVIKSNLLSNNRYAGIDMRLNCHDNFVLNNTIKNNVVAGLSLMESGKNTVKGNAITGNGRYGVQVQSGSEGNTIINNTISMSQTGIFLDASLNTIYGNALVENVVQADDRGKNTWNAGYPEGGNLWSDYLGKDLMSGPDQDVPGADRFGDQPYRINEEAVDKYPIIGKQVRQVEVLEKSISPTQARVGDNIAVKAKLKSKYGLSQVTARAFSGGEEAAAGYARMVPSGDIYQGSLSTALMDPGRYDIMLIARDLRGFELKERIGEVEVSPRGGSFGSSD